MSPAVTVAIPTWNRSHLLRQALTSVLDQTLTDFEVVVADNASDDATAQVVASFDDDRIHHAPVPENIGFSANHLRCLTLGTAPLLVILQDDDLLDRRSLEEKVRALEDPSVSMVHSAFRVTDLDHGRVLEAAANWDRSPVNVVRDGAEFLARTFGAGKRSHVSASMYRRDALAITTLDETDGEAIELALSLRAALHGRVAFLAEPLGTIRYHQNQNAVRGGVSALDFERTFAQIALFRDATTRFLDRFEDRIAGATALRRASRSWMRMELRRQIVARLPDGRHPGVALRMLREAADVEPSVLRDAKSVWVIANAFAGRRGRSTLAAARQRFGTAKHRRRTRERRDVRGSPSGGTLP